MFDLVKGAVAGLVVVAILGFGLWEYLNFKQQVIYTFQVLNQRIVQLEKERTPNESSVAEKK